MRFLLILLALLSPALATDYYYFNTVGDGDLSNAGNWFLDDAQSTPAGVVPAGPTDNAILFATTTAGVISCGDLWVRVGNSLLSSNTIAGKITLDSGAIIYSGDLTTSGNIELNGECEAQINSAVNVTIGAFGTFNAGASFSGTLDIYGIVNTTGGGVTGGTIIFEAGATISGIFTASAGITCNGGFTDNGSTINPTGVFTIGNSITSEMSLTCASLENYGNNNGVISCSGTATFHSGSNNSNSITASAISLLSGSQNGGTLSGTTQASGTAINTGSIFGSCTLTGTAVNRGVVSGVLNAAATDNGDGTYGYAPGALGQFGTLKLTGILAGTPGDPAPEVPPNVFGVAF